MNPFYRKIAAVGVLLMAGISSVWAADGTQIQIMDPWVREAPPTAQALAAYLTIVNHGARERTVVKAESPAFGKVEMHQTIHKGDMAMMQAQETLVLPSHGRLEMKPGGYHIMLIAPQSVMKAGENVPLALTFADGEIIELKVPVRKATGEDLSPLQQHDSHADHGAPAAPAPEHQHMH
jgi:hypothetical protein